MLRSLLQDAALAAAKGYSHPQVEPRHVLFAVARQFRDRPEVGPLFPVAKGALEPRGSSHGVPELTPEARTLLDSISSDGEAIAALVAAHPSGGKVGGEPPSATQAKPVLGQGAPPVAAAAAPSGATPESTADILAELDGLIGLASVKAQLKRIIAVVQANEERSKAGLVPVSSGLHLVFTGPPGTGKTTVARLVARLYASTGALPGSNFTEAARSDLVAGYVGQTAIKTTDLITRTRPGVLFIDEAYALTPSHGSDFGAEAIASLVKAMEDYRREFAVIVAGYGEEMSEFIASNPGLRSRFKTYVAFPNYSAEELIRIFEGIARQASLGLASGVMEKAEGIFRRAVGTKDFGNARFARSLFEEAYARMSARAAADGSVRAEELTEITVEDVVWQEGAIQKETRRIGFERKSGGAAID